MESHAAGSKRQIPSNLYRALKDRNANEAARARISNFKADQADLSHAEDLPEVIASQATTSCWGLFSGPLTRYHCPAVALAPRIPSLELPKKYERMTRVNCLLQRRVPLPGDYFLDKVYRNFITGSIELEGVQDGADFDYIDLLDRRDALDATPSAFLDDEFIFKASPLYCRTWYYQSTFERENSIDVLVRRWNDGQKSIRSMTAVRAEVIEKHLVESSPWRCGSYSPALGCLAASVVSCFSIDVDILVVHLLLLFACIRISLRANSATWFRLDRSFSLVFRVLSIAWILSMGTSPPMQGSRPLSSSPVPGSMRLMSGIVLLLDVIFGDLMQIYKHCWSSDAYKIIKQLSDRVFLCEPKGRGHACSSLPASVIGADLFEAQSRGNSYVIVVDAEGFIVRLDPLKITDLPNPASTIRPLATYCTRTFNCDARYPESLPG